MHLSTHPVDRQYIDRTLPYRDRIKLQSSRFERWTPYILLQPCSPARLTMSLRCFRLTNEFARTRLKSVFPFAQDSLLLDAIPDTNEAISSVRRFMTVNSA